MADGLAPDRAASAQRVAPRRHTEHGAERKRQLLDAAHQLFSQHGFAATRVADICAAAGVAKGLFYWYFPTKESLFAELVRSMRHELRRAQAAAMDPTANPVVQLRQGTAASVRFVAVHRSFFALLDMERADPAHAALLREGADVYAADVQRLITAAQIDGLIPNGDPEVLTAGVMGAVSSFSHALRTGQVTADPDTLASAVANWVAQALTGSRDYSVGLSSASG
jgi:AcrR family transcriptional regulator